MNQIQKDYDQPFLLEPTKLIRVIDTIHERMAGHQHPAIRDHFEIFLAGNRREQMTNLDDVLALDNSRKHRIQRLVVHCFAPSDATNRSDDEVEVDFGAPKDTSATDGNSKKTVVAIRVRSDNSGWARRTLSEVEEQVERAWLRYVPSVLGIIGISLLLLILLSSQLDLARVRGEDLARTMWLQRSDLERFEPYVRGQRFMTDQELRELFTTQLRNVLEAERPAAATLGGKGIFILIPVLGILGCMIILIATCYPKTVFLWGDEVERYKALLERRKILWSLIIGILFVGLLSKFLAEGLIPWLPSG